MEPLREAWRRLRTVPSFYWDLAIATALTIGTQLTGDYGDSQFVRIPALAPMLFTWRRRFPLAVYVVVVTAVFIYGDRNGVAATVAGAYATYSVALYSRHRWISLLLVLATSLAIVAIYGGGLPSLPDYAGPFLILVPFWLAGNAIRIRQLRADLFEARALHLLQQQEQSRQAAVIEERGRIARELHDVVAHTVSVMVVQAGAAREVLKGDSDAPPEATNSLLSIESSGREALAELRQMLGALFTPFPSTTRSTSPSPFQGEGREGVLWGLSPQPGLDQLDALVERVRETGLPLTLEVRGARHALPRGTDIAAYRIIQEALTNAIKYADRAPTDVVIEYRAHDLKVEVLDNGPGIGRNDGPAGHGLTGMKERVAVFGGRLEAGPRLERGFAVRAWLPLDQGVND